MKVTFLTTPYQSVYKYIQGLFYPQPSLGLMYIASVLKKNRVDVSFFDMHFYEFNEKIINEIRDSDLVGLTCMTSTSEITYEIAKRIKGIFSDKPIAIGGAHPTALPDEVIKNDFIDFVIVGEGEFTFLQLVQNLKTRNFEVIKGLVYKDDGRIIHNQRRPLIENLDDLPFPAYELVDIKKYGYPIQRRHPMMTISTSRGCPGTCTFCNKRIFGNNFRGRSAKNVVDEMELLHKKYGVKEIHIVDDAFSTDIERAKMICDEIIRRKLKIIWGCPAGVRVDAVDQELLLMMRKAGCYFVSFGLESADDDILKSIGKKTAVRMNRKAVEMAKRAKLETALFYIIGLPYDTKETVEKTIEFARQMRGDYSKFAILTPYPGTAVYNFLMREKRLTIDKWSDLLCHNEVAFEPFYLTKEDVKRYWKIAYKKVTFTPPLYIR